MIDAHCHLQFHSFEEDYDEAAKRALAAGVIRIINTGTKLDSSQKAIEFAEKYEYMYAIIGVHPHHADKIDVNPKSEARNSKQSEIQNDINHKQTNWIKELMGMGKHPKVIGIGEIGLDYFSYQSNGIVDKKIQKEVFEKQIALAHDLGLPLQIHNRQAGEDIIQILRYYKDSLQPVPGMFHCFAGSMEVLKAALDLGFYIGFDGNVTYKGLAPGESTDLKDIAAYVPCDRMITETDSPFLAPVPHRGQRNEPANVIVTAHFLSELKKTDYEYFDRQVIENVRRVFPKLK